MELHQLRYFVSVIEAGSIAGAAKNCQIAQPSLSLQIHKLEEELGAKAFRAPPSRSAAHSGELVLRSRRLDPLGGRCGARFTEGPRQPRARADSNRRHSNGCAVPAAASPAPIDGRYCQAEVTVHEDFTENLIRACLAGEVDLGLVALPIEDDRVLVEPLFCIGPYGGQSLSARSP
jgi:LysR family transcriptional regulator, hydrogen peroxide-inducible genes activator